MVRLCWITMEKVINLGLVALMSRWSLVVNHGAQVGAWIEGVMVQFGLWVFFGYGLWSDLAVVCGFLSFFSYCGWW